jgi:hypothetical protein
MAIRKNDALLEGKAQGQGVNNDMLDLSYGGQMGYANNLTEWVSNAAYVRRHIFPILIASPLFFEASNYRQKLTDQLRALIERHPIRIEGLKSDVEAEFAETPVGGAGEMQEEVTNTKRARSVPNFSYFEKYGRPIQNFLEWWITFGMMDPDTKIANVGTLATAPTDMLPDRYTMTTLFIEPDAVHGKVAKAWLCANMMPKGTGEILGSADRQSAMSLLELSIEFTALTQKSNGVDYWAQQVLNTIKITDANPYMRDAFFKDIYADVQAANTGYAKSVADVRDTAIANTQ